MASIDRSNIVMIGSSGHAKVVIDIIEREGKHRLAGLIDSFIPAGNVSYGYPILGTEEDLPDLVERHALRGCFIAIGDNWKRHLMAEKIMVRAPALEFVNAVHPSAQIARGATIGRGSVCMAGAIVNSDSRVGEFCIINTNASLDHDSVLGDFCSLAPCATTGGNVTIGAFSAVSLGACIIHGRKIGKHTVIGTGAVVLDDIPDSCVAHGVPARVIRERQQGEAYL